MSCEECEEIQKVAFDKNINDSIPIAYVRIGNGNVAIVGCQKHLKELLDKYRGEVL